MNEVLLMEEKKEKALLVGLNITSTARKIDDIDINESMEELKEIVKKEKIAEDEEYEYFYVHDENQNQNQNQNQN